MHNETLLGVKIDSKLSFNTHIDDICKKTSFKLNVLSRITAYLDVKKKKLLINYFLCPSLTIVSQSEGAIIAQKDKINRLHQRCLGLLYNDKNSSFHDSLEKDSSVSILHRIWRALATEMYRIYNSLRYNNNYLRSWSDFTLPIVRT